MDLEDVFRFIDRTLSRPGQQYLYYLLRCIPATSERAARLENRIDTLQESPSLRATVSKELSKLHERDAYYISSLFQGEHIQKPKWLWAIQLLAALAVISVILSFFVPKISVLLIILFPINMGIHYWNKSNVYQYSSSIPQLLIMHKAARRILASDAFQEYGDVSASITSLAKILPQMLIFKIEARLQSEIGQLVDYLFELIKALFLLEPIVLFSSLQKLETRKEEIGTIFRFIGETDAALSILAMRESVPYFCNITHDPSGKGLIAQSVYHPLLFNGVSNDILLKGRSALLTGSNMSGKTTFIRTVGISAILGQTLNTCFAKEFAMPFMRVESSIRIADDLLDEKSYYMEEVLVLKELIGKSDNGKPALILLDEIFKGTNSIERIAISKSVLNYLHDNGNLVFVSTHDRELTELLSENYELYHFTEIIDGDQIAFDYKIKPGVLNTTNAIRILAINNFPPQIIQEANALSLKLRQM
ncbi:DNA mismatch repair protein MutS [Dyadobacter sp. CY261]|nr:DNA mismatch repair protein MutS [Dyadobacter sp. CY261]